MEEKEKVNSEEITEIPETKESKEKKKKEKKDKHQEEILKLTEQLALEQDKAMRIQAEMMNFRRRKEEEVEGIRKYKNEEILKNLLSVVDNFERAFQMETEESIEFLKGFKMIHESILTILKENQVTEIECLNQEFDPNFHQAVFTEAREGVESGIVIEVLQKGYMYKDKLLRPSMVKVSE